MGRGRTKTGAVLVAVGLGLGPVLVAQTALAEGGRYQAVVMHEGGRTGTSGNLYPRVFLIDTVEGHLWTWEENTRLGGPDKGTFGTALIYQGRVSPGARPGDVVTQRPGP